MPVSHATKVHRNNQQGEQAARFGMAPVDLRWEHKGELFIHSSAGPWHVQEDTQGTGGLVTEEWT